MLMLRKVNLMLISLNLFCVVVNFLEGCRICIGGGEVFFLVVGFGSLF